MTNKNFEKLFDRVFEKLDSLKDTANETKIKTVKIEEHLKTLNGKVLRQEKEIEGNRQHLYKNSEKINQFEKDFSEQISDIKIYVKSKFSKYGGGIVVLSFIIGIIIAFLK
jgi:predicted  nucleic acid-binding Zn-ribbon protein